MPTLLESNPAGDLTLIESGCYGFTGNRANGYQFDDPSLTDWTDRSSNGAFSVSGGVLSVEKLLLLMWSKASVSPQHLLPNSQIITTLRCRWNIDNSQDNRPDYVANAVALMSTSPLPWQTGGFAMGSGGKIFFGDFWRPWTYENGVFDQYHTGMVADGSNDHWEACRVEPDGVALVCDCSGGGLNIIQGGAGEVPDAPLTWCNCDPDNFGLAGNPGLVSWQLAPGVGSPTEYMEWHAFFSRVVKVIGLPTGWKGRVIKVGDAARSPNTITSVESGGEATVEIVGGQNLDMPPWDEVQVLDASNVVMSSIQVRTFQPGTYGGDVYCYQCAFPCPPPGTESFFFFGQQVVQPVTKTILTSLDAELFLDITKQVVTSLDGVVLLAGAMTQSLVGLVQEDDFNRADSDTVGTGWSELEGDFDILSNVLRAQTINRALVENTTRAKAVEWFQQACVWWSNATQHAELAFIDYQASAEDGYGMVIDDGNSLIELFEYNAGSRTSLGVSAAETMNSSTFYCDCQFYKRAGVQEGYFKGAGSGVTISASDTTHDAKDVAPMFVRWFGSLNHQQYDDSIICLSKNIVVTSLPTGWKAKVRNGADAVVAEATESGGTATIDASLFGGATERVPLGGWPVLQVTDGADVEQNRWENTNPGFAGVYPGDSYAN